jgi:hypothetical protein
MKVGQRRLSGWQRVLLMRFLLLVALILVLAGSLVLQSTAHAQSERGSIGTIASTAELTYGEWNARWWQWFFSVPASKNPGLATNGAVDCSVGQSGDVWFLAGYFLGSGSFTRSCTIPAGKALFIPLINSWADNICNTPPLTVDQLRALAANFVSSPAKLHASIDDSPLLSQRAISPVFSYNLPSTKDNVIYAAFGVKLPGPCWPSLHVDPAVADGFYTMLPPLSAGSHSINFGGSGGTGPTRITLNVTYNLTVGS